MLLASVRSFLTVVACLSLSTLACGDRQLTLPLPDGISAEDSIVVMVDAPGRPRVFAARASDVLSIHEETNVGLSLLHYRRALDDLPFEAGEISSANEGCLLVEAWLPDEVWSASTDEAGAWRPSSVGALPGFGRSFTVPTEACPIDPCPKWQVERVELPGATGNASWSVALPGGVALIGTIGNQVVRVDANDPTHPRQLSLEPPQEFLRSASADRHGHLWLGSLTGVSRGHLDGARLSFESLDPMPPEFVRMLGGETSTSGAGLFAVIGSGALIRYTGVDWEVVTDELQPVDPDSGVRGSIATTGPQEIVMAWSEDQSIFRYRDGQLLDETPERLIEAAGAVAQVEEVGTVLVTAPRGLVFHHQGTRWTPLDESSSISARAIAPLEGGYLIVGDSGLVRPYLVDEGIFCPTLTAFGPDVRVIERLEPGVYIVAGHTAPLAGTPATSAAIIRRVAP